MYRVEFFSTQYTFYATFVYPSSYQNLITSNDRHYIVYSISWLLLSITTPPQTVTENVYQSQT